MKITATALMSGAIIAMMAASFAVGLVLSVFPPYRAVAFAGLACLILTVTAVPVSLVLGIVAALRKNKNDLIWSCILFAISAGSLVILMIGGMILENL
jgi:hypothetical protein